MVRGFEAAGWVAFLFFVLRFSGMLMCQPTPPSGGSFMDVIQLLKVNENFRLIYDVKGRYVNLSS